MTSRSSNRRQRSSSNAASRTTGISVHGRSITRLRTIDALGFGLIGCLAGMWLSSRFCIRVCSIAIRHLHSV